MTVGRMVTLKPVPVILILLMLISGARRLYLEQYHPQILTRRRLRRRRGV